VGNHGKILRRNSPSLFNVALAAPFFHDGRQSELDLQPLEVLLDPDEMAFPSLAAVVTRVKSLPEYGTLFEQAFEGLPSAERIGQALGSYLRTLLSADSPFDRWYFGGEPDALTPASKRGFFLFFGDAGCAECHQVTQEAALFTDHAFHNTGVARAGSDLGRYEVTHDSTHRWQFKTPILRNVSSTAPYMHDGSLATLREVVEFYNQGGFPHEGIDPRIQPLGLSKQEKDDLVEFLESLTGDNIDELVRDAQSHAVGDISD
jgi:cytochrome c peroxidase